MSSIGMVTPPIIDDFFEEETYVEILINSKKKQIFSRTF